VHIASVTILKDVLENSNRRAKCKECILQISDDAEAEAVVKRHHNMDANTHTQADMCMYAGGPSQSMCTQAW
jgi:hypothetical protein